MGLATERAELVVIKQIHGEAHKWFLNLWDRLYGCPNPQKLAWKISFVTVGHLCLAFMFYSKKGNKKLPSILQLCGNNHCAKLRFCNRITIAAENTVEVNTLA